MPDLFLISVMLPLFVLRNEPGHAHVGALILFASPSSTEAGWGSFVSFSPSVNKLD